MIPAIDRDKLNEFEIKTLSSFLKKMSKTNINVIFKIIGVTAIEANFPSVFKYAPINDVKQINNTNGNDNLDKSIESINLSEFE